jgi:endonuclease/exonuclease/phosphatase family metal-dependent hydrolase
VRVIQAREVLGFMANDRPGPLLLMGDMNANQDSPTLDTLRGGGLRDAWAEARPGDQTGTNQAGTRRIDYVLWHEPDARVPGVRILDAWTRGPNVDGETGAMVSDHKAVVVTAEVRLPR